MTEKINANKTNINKILTWSTSKWNEWKKSEATEDILNHVKEGKHGTWEYGTGSYSERGYLGGWKYYLSIHKNGRAFLTSTISKKKYELILKKHKK